MGIQIKVVSGIHNIFEVLNLLKTIIIPIINLALILLYIWLLSVSTLIEIAIWLQYTVYIYIYSQFRILSGTAVWVFVLSMIHEVNWVYMISICD
jgi:hypothetical protein